MNNSGLNPMKPTSTPKKLVQLFVDDLIQFESLQNITIIWVYVWQRFFLF
jgi:hypothetical protein